ncbi:MAG: hypothetical protein ACK5LK_03475 [Chthoniobacterales bacterium]
MSIPATDGRQVRLKRYTKPEKVHRLLLDQLGFTLPAQPPPEIRCNRSEAARTVSLSNPMSVVETY